MIGRNPLFLIPLGIVALALLAVEWRGASARRRASTIVALLAIGPLIVGYSERQGGWLGVGVALAVVAAVLRRTPD